MKLEQQVVSLELAKKLKELGECSECEGYGKEICTNPDHSGIEVGLYGEENSRMGCPVCGHNENHLTKYDCEKCKGKGTFLPESLHSFNWIKAHQEYELDNGSSIGSIPAFTVAELGEMLLPYCYSAKSESTFGKYRCWRYMDEERRSSINDRDEFYADTEADARAKMLVYLLENKLITL